MSGDYLSRMRDIEERFRTTTGFSDRSWYKIFYGQVHPAPILLLGANPGADPSDIMPDGVGRRNSRNRSGPASSSAGYFENDEHDVLDCDFRENRGLLLLLEPLFDHDRSRIRLEVVKTNMAFRRGPQRTKIDKIDFDSAVAESAPYLGEMIQIVSPRLILLTGVKIDLFAKFHAKTVKTLMPEQRNSAVKQVVFAAASAVLKHSAKESTVVQVAHASQFFWTYDRYNVVARIKDLVDL